MADLDRSGDVDAWVASSADSYLRLGLWLSESRYRHRCAVGKVMGSELLGPTAAGRSLRGHRVTTDAPLDDPAIRA